MLPRLFNGGLESLTARGMLLRMFNGGLESLTARGMILRLFNAGLESLTARGMLHVIAQTHKSFIMALKFTQSHFSIRVFF